jgi:hypothetical protein
VPIVQHIREEIAVAVRRNRDEEVATVDGDASRPEGFRRGAASDRGRPGKTGVRAKAARSIASAK